MRLLAGIEREKAANSPERTTDVGLPALLLRKSRTRTRRAHARKKPGSRNVTKPPSFAFWRRAAIQPGRCAHPHTHRRTHESREVLKADALWSTSDALRVDCALTGAASAGSTRWPSLPSAPIGTGDRTCKSELPIDVFQKRIKGGAPWRHRAAPQRLAASRAEPLLRGAALCREKRTAGVETRLLCWRSLASMNH